MTTAFQVTFLTIVRSLTYKKRADGFQFHGPRSILIINHGNLIQRHQQVIFINS